MTIVEIYEDRVEISNPGGLLPAVQKEFGTRSMSRNPLIFGLFTRMNLVEQVASGIPRMRDSMKEAGLPEPIFTVDGGFFTVMFKRPNDGDTLFRSDDPVKSADGIVNGIVKTTDNTVNDPVRKMDDTVNDIVKSVDDTVKINSANEKKVFELIKSNEGLSASEIAALIGKSLRTTMRYIGALRKAEIIEFRGAPKTGGYYLK